MRVQCGVFGPKAPAGVIQRVGEPAGFLQIGPDQTGVKTGTFWPLSDSRMTSSTFWPTATLSKS